MPPSVIDHPMRYSKLARMTNTAAYRNGSVLARARNERPLAAEYDDGDGDDDRDYYDSADERY